jgi:hypothetical protein
MTHRVRHAFGRLLASGLASALALLLVASSLVAQQTSGKIQGTVTDPQGSPIASAQVTIVGTAFGTLSDAKGYYFFNNVPVGTYTLRARFIGYTPAEIPGVRVLGGYTLTEDFKLTPSAVAVGPVTVEAAANPIVPRDQVTSRSVVHNVNKLPVDDVRQVIALQPGVVESNAGAGLVLRGGRPGEANVYIDGVPVRSQAFGSQIVQVNRNAVEEASVTTGALGVDVGDAQSGIIAYTTRQGSPKVQGSALYETDQAFGDAISVGYNRFEGTLGGPIPSIPNLTWFASGLLQGQSSPFQGVGQDTVPNYVMGGVDTTVTVTKSDGSVLSVPIPRFVQFGGQCPTGSDAANPARNAILQNYGFSCQGRRLPLAFNTVAQVQAKLAYSYGSGSNISLTGLASGNQFRNWPGSSIGDPLLYTGEHTWSRLGVLNWSHQIFRTAERQLALNVRASYQQDRRIDGTLDPTWDLANRDPSLGIDMHTIQFTGVTGMPFPITDQTITNIRTNQGLRTPFLNRTDLRNSQPYRMNPYGEQSGGWSTSGQDVGGSQLYSENRYYVFGQVDWQANRYHRFNLGGEYKKSDLSRWTSSLITQIFMNAYIEHPETYGLWAADRLDLGDVVLELGLRYDYLNSKALFPTTPGYIFSNPLWSPLAATNADSLAASIARVFTPASAHHTLSPRLRVSFPITERTDFRLSYSHQVQTPDFNTLLSGLNNDLSFTNTNDSFGRDATFGKTILFEFGVRHAFSPDLVLDVSAYNKDFVSDLAFRIRTFPDPQHPGSVVNVNILTNSDFGYARGIDMKLDRRIGTWFNASVAYTFQVASSTGSDPNSYLRTSARQVVGVTGERVPPPEQPLPTDDNRKHNVVGSVTMSVPAGWHNGTALGAVLRDVSFFATFRAVSGLPYTRLQNSGGGSFAPREGFGIEANAVEPQNSSTMPWQKFLDVRLNKAVKVGRTDWTLFVDARNVLNFKNVTRLFAETGDVVNAVNRLQSTSPEASGLTIEAKSNNALFADGSIDLHSCSTWTASDAATVNCVLLQRAEARFGNGDLLYSPAEQAAALNAAYNLFTGVQTMYGQPRHIRIGAELSF